jgi:CRISPR-associated endonuclease/helicase Cas3
MFISRITEDNREQLTKQHLNDTANYALILGKKFSISKIAYLTGLYHDMGKYSEEFVKYLKLSAKSTLSNSKAPIKGTVIHATQGAKYLYELNANNKDIIYAIMIEIVSMCIASHHGVLMDGISIRGETPLIDRITSNKEKLHYDEVKVNYNKEMFDNDTVNMIRECQAELLNFVSVCKQNNLNTAFMLHLLTKTVFSCLVDADRYNAYCYEVNKDSFKILKPDWANLAKRLEERISQFNIVTEIARIRSNISTNCLYAATLPQGIYSLSVPTGGGKTLSSLRFALNHAKTHELDRIIYVIPFLSVIDQTAKEIKKALYRSENEDFILEHHSNVVMPDTDNELQSRHLLTDRWDRPIIITTMVQFLESIYSCKASDLRKMHNMANSVIIFDEIQALPLKCVHLFNEAVNYLHFFGKSTILLCTATQPPLNEVFRPVHLSIPSEIISDSCELFTKLKRTRIKDKTKTGGYSIRDLCNFVIKKVNSIGNCLVVLNTKADVLKLYKAATDYVKSNPESNINVIHLSTSMCPAHRLAVIDSIKEMKVGDKILCISTQLIEAGVDLSFKCVIRALAGLDSIAQAAGRCNRNGEEPNGRDVFLINLSEEDLSKLPDIKCGADITYKILMNSPDDLLSPDTMKCYYNEYFYKRRNEMDFTTENSGTLYDLLSLNCKGYGAYLNIGGKTPPALVQAFETAGLLFSVIEERTTSVLVPYKRGSELIEEYRMASLDNKRRLLSEIGLYSVSLYPHQLRKLDDIGAVHWVNDEVLYLDKGYYDEQLGVTYELDISKYFC